MLTLYADTSCVSHVVDINFQSLGCISFKASSNLVLHIVTMSHRIKSFSYSSILSSCGMFPNLKEMEKIHNSA